MHGFIRTLHRSRRRKRNFLRKSWWPLSFGILLIECMPKAITIMGNVCKNTIWQLKNGWTWKKCHNFILENFAFAQLLKVRNIQKLINEYSFQELHTYLIVSISSPGSITLKRASFFITSSLEKAEMSYFGVLPKRWKYKKRWNKCFSVCGSYVEK